MLLFSALLKKNQRSPEEQAEMEEHAALNVLRRWGEMNEFLPGALPLVPEHVEIRSLQNQDNPGLPQVRTITTDSHSSSSDDVLLLALLHVDMCFRVTFTCGWTCFPRMSRPRPLLTSSPAYPNSRWTHSEIQSSRTLWTSWDLIPLKYCLAVDEERPIMF